MERLKRLLLEDELRLLEELVSKVERLEFETLDEAAIRAKILPLFDDLLLRRLSEKESGTLKALSDYIAEIIAERVARDPQKMSRALQDVISPAIAQGIADNKEKMIDALYPIMGGMISKYVTQAIKEMMETINKKIEQGFSVERYKRKVKVKLTGVSESELLIEESSDADLLAMFVIHKETGLLISEAHLEESGIGDVQMVASMASAIKDFINDWISSGNETKKEVQILSYGDATLYIESAGSVYLIAFLESEPDYEQRSEINDFFAALLKRYARFFQNFDGDDSVAEVAQISERMHRYLTERQGMKSSKNGGGFAFALFGFLGLGLLFYGGYRIADAYTVYSVTERIKAQTGEEVRIVPLEEEEGYLLQGSLNDPSHMRSIERIAKDALATKKIKNDFVLTTEGVERVRSETIRTILSEQEKRMRAYEKAFESELKRVSQALREEVRQEKRSRETLQKQLDDALQKERKLAMLASLPEQIGARLKRALGDTPYYDAAHMRLNFATLHLFEEGKTEADAEKREKLLSVFERYIAVLSHYKPYIKKITLYSYSDSKGDAEENLNLTMRRAAYIGKYAQATMRRYGMQHLLEVLGKGEEDPVMRNGEEDYEASRRVEIGFKLDRDTIVKEIRKLSVGKNGEESEVVHPKDK